MLLFNLIIVILTIILQYCNFFTITKTIKIKDTFMYVKLVPNDFVYSAIKPYKMKILMYNRIFFLLTLLCAPFFIFFNNSSVLLAIYVIIFLILPFFVNQAIISNYLNEVKKLDSSHQNQDIKVTHWGLLCHNENCSLLYKYGFHRYAVNTSSTKGKLVLSGIIGAVIIFLAVLVIFMKPALNYNKVNSTLTETSLTINYGEKTTNIEIKDISEIKKFDEVPKIISRVDGVEENNYKVGIFNLEKFPKANLYIKENDTSYLRIKAGKTFYFYSDGSLKNSNKIYEVIIKEVISRKKH